MVDRIKAFFDGCERVWSIVPNYVKIFIYSVSSVIVGMYIAGEPITIKTVVAILAANLGIYGVPRVIAKETRKLL